MSTVKENDTIKVHYTGKLKSGEVFDTSEQREPLEFKVGEGRLIKGFENAVIGMKVDEKKSVDIPSDEAYGPVQDELIQQVPKTQLPQDLKPEVGMELVSQLPNGNKIPVKIVQVENDHVMIDANHPLAGKDLVFDIKLVEIS